MTELHADIRYCVVQVTMQCTAVYMVQFVHIEMYSGQKQDFLSGTVKPLVRKL